MTSLLPRESDAGAFQVAAALHDQVPYVRVVEGDRVEPLAILFALPSLHQHLCHVPPVNYGQAF